MLMLCVLHNHSCQLFDQVDGVARSEVPVAGRWYVLSCKPNKEGILLRQLQSQGYEVFYPQHFSTNGKTGRLHIKAYFPGYLFIRLDLNQVGQSTFQWMPNAEGLVSFESRPAFVPDILVEAIKKHVEKINATRVKEYARSTDREDSASQLGNLDASYGFIFDANISSDERVQQLMHMLQW